MPSPDWQRLDGPTSVPLSSFIADGTSLVLRKNAKRMRSNASGKTIVSLFNKSRYCPRDAGSPDCSISRNAG
jgi:hypothetical protein